MRMSESSDSNKVLAIDLASSVLPTPVGPRNTKVPIGLFGFLSPILFRCMALVIFSIAASCPMTDLRNSCCIFLSLDVSSKATLATGIPVIIAITSAI